MKVNPDDICMVIEPDPEPLEGQGDSQAYGVRAAIDLKVPYGADFILVPVRSPGLWSIYMRSDEYPYLEEVFKEEKDVLITLLKNMGMEVGT